ncbi:MAG: hypothetical protein ACREP7_18300 [Lysobacter sp.]
MHFLHALFNRFADAVIARAQRTPYFHLRNSDGTPYMDRFWLLRIGRSGQDSQGNAMPWIALRVHHIRSSDEGRDFHDHPWAFFSLILRGGYYEERPYTGPIIPPKPVDLRVEKTSGQEYTRSVYYAPRLLFRRARQWHRLRLPGELAQCGTWTLVLTLPKSQEWGFLFNGMKIDRHSYGRVRKLAAASAVSRRANGHG